MWRGDRELGLVLFFLACGTARAGEPPKPPPAAPAPQPSPPPTPEQAADAVHAAVKAKDAGALKSLAAQDEPDPWLVADELIRRGEFDAADAFARAARRVDVERLPEHVAFRRGKPDDPARRARLAASNAELMADKFADALAALGAEEPAPIHDVVGVRLAMGRGIALEGLVRLEASAAAFRASGEAAERLGWWARAVRALFRAGSCAARSAAFAAARDVWARARSICERRGDRANAAAILVGIGDACESLGDHAKALATLEQALTQLEALGDKAEISRCLGSIGLVLLHQRNYAEARSKFERALALAEEIGSRSGSANALNNLAIVHLKTGDVAKALSNFEQALVAQEALGDKAAMAACLVNIGNVYSESRRDYAHAISHFKRGLALAEESGQRLWAANALQGLGLVHKMRGEYAQAAARFEAALAKVEASGDRDAKANILGNLGLAYLDLGEFAKALAFAEQALALLEAMGDKVGAAGALVNVGSVYSVLGDAQSARSHFERGLAMAEEIGHRQWAVNALGNLGGVCLDLGDTEKALATYQQVLAQMEALGDRSGATVALLNIGIVQTRLRDYPKALATLGQVLSQQEAQGDKADIAWTHGILGKVYADLGDFAKARASYESERRIAKSLRLARELVNALENLAVLYLNAGQSARALGAAGEALREVENMMGGLGEEQGARAREKYVKLFALGTVAAVREDDVAEALTFLESGRAGALLDALGRRDLVRWKAETLTEDLRAADEKTKAAERAARQSYDEALSSAKGNRAEIRAAATTLDEALDDVRAVNERVEREGRRGAGLYYPRPKTLEDIQAALDGGEALVLFGLCLDEALALVVTPTGERVVSLGARTAVDDACAALDATDPTADVLPALATLRKTLIVPLALGSDVKRVVVSPEGPLGYLPFGALFNVPVAMTPSGTTHVLLHDEDREPGEQILALGDPDYAATSYGAQKVYFRGRMLSRLPATRAEAEQIGTTTLVGAAASEDGLRSALAGRKRWRAVHFACHGLVDPERPTLSSLALTPDAKNDGFLTALEVLRMEIPSDLVVLSACETGKGKIVGGEGIVGLTRAFMHAGSPRVICSLWKVDDEATRALMTEFYRLWNPKDGKPGLSTAEALRKGQEFVRSQEKWKHPYFWAAWVLWGLPS